MAPFDESLQMCEDKIEVARLDQDWETVKAALQEYSKVFDFTYDISTKYHANLKEMKSYYWVCSAEYTFHLTGDFNASIDCLRRAGAFHYSSIEIRILIIRFFLAACRQSIAKLKSPLSTSKSMKNVKNFDLENLQLYLYLGDFVKQFPKESVEKLQTYLDAVSDNEKSALINVLATFSNEDVYHVCQEFLHYQGQLKNIEQSLTSNFVSFMMIICLYLLRNVRLNTLYDKFSANELSIYQYWLHLDATILRANIHELLFDYKNAHVDLLSILFHTNMQQNFSNLPGICCSVVLFTAVKLCLVENHLIITTNNDILENNSNHPEIFLQSSFEIFHQNFKSGEQTENSNSLGHTSSLYSSLSSATNCWKSYFQCLSDEGLWKSYLPMPMMIVLTLEMTFTQLSLLFQLQKQLSLNKTITSEENKKIIRFKLIEIFHNLQILYEFFQDKSNEKNLLTISHKLMSNYEYLPQSSNQFLPDYESDVIHKGLQMKLSWIMILFSSLVYSLNLLFGHPISIYPANSEEKESKPQQPPLQIPDSIAISKPIEEIYGLLSWGFQMEIVPNISILWHLSHFYYLIDENMKEKAFQLLKQCQEKILLEFNIRKTFYRKHQITLLSSSSGQQSHGKANKKLFNNLLSDGTNNNDTPTRSMKHFQHLSIDIFIESNDINENKLNSYVHLLGLSSNILSFPYLAIGSLSELILQKYSFNNSFQDYFFIEKSLPKEFSVSPPSSSSSSSSSSPPSNRKADDLHEMIELIIVSIKQFYDSFGDKMIDYIFNTHIISSSTVRFTSKTELDSGLADPKINKKLFSRHPPEADEEDDDDDEDNRHHRENNIPQDKITTDFIFEKGLESRYDCPSSISFLISGNNRSNRIKSMIQSLIHESLEIKEIKGLILLLIQLGKCFMLYLQDSMSSEITPAIKFIYSKIIFNIFYYLIELMEYFVTQKENELSLSSSASASSSSLPVGHKNILDIYFDNSIGNNNLFANFYLLQMEIIFNYLFILTEFDANRSAIELIKDLLKPNPLQDELKKIFIPFYLEQSSSFFQRRNSQFSSPSSPSRQASTVPRKASLNSNGLKKGTVMIQKSYWQKYERKLIHLLVLLLTHPNYAPNPQLPGDFDEDRVPRKESSSIQQEPERYALALSLLQKVLQDEKALYPARSSSSQSIVPYDLNLHYSLMLVYYYSGERKLSISKCEELMKEILTQMHHYLFPSPTSSSSSVVAPSAPVSPSGKNSAGAAPSLSSRSSFYLKRNGQFSSTPNAFLIPVIYEKTNIERYHNRYQLVKYLLRITAYFFSLHKYSHMKLCLLESWKFLYSLHPEIQERLQYISNHTIDSISEHELIDAMRYVPTVIGRQLSNGHGWGVVHFPDLEAEILYYTGLVLQYDTVRSTVAAASAANQNEENGIFGVGSTEEIHTKRMKDLIFNEQSLEFFQLAIHLCPTHIKSLLALANIYYEKYLEEMKPYYLTIRAQYPNRPKPLTNVNNSQNIFVFTQHHSHPAPSSAPAVGDNATTSGGITKEDINAKKTDRIQWTKKNPLRQHQKHKTKQHQQKKNGEEFSFLLSDSDTSDDEHDEHRRLTAQQPSKQNEKRGIAETKEQQDNHDSESNHNSADYQDLEDHQLTRSYISANLAMANFYVRRALSCNDKHPDAWKIYSFVAKAMGLEEISLEALITSAECEQILPIRSYHCVHD